MIGTGVGPMIYARDLMNPEEAMGRSGKEGTILAANH